MPTIIHEKDYIQKQKLKYIVLSSIFLIIILIFYTLYIINSKSALKNYFIVLGALFAVPAGISITRYILFFKYKDCNSKIADELSTLPSYCYIINNALFTNGNKNKFIDNIVIINNNIICIVDSSKKYSLEAVNLLDSILKTKGIDYKLVNMSLDKYNLSILNKYLENQQNDSQIFNTIKTYLI